MTNKEGTSIGSELSTATSVGFYAAILTTVTTIVTFGFAMTAIPISGANCPGDCVEYPYLNTIAQYPKDFIWMYLAMFLVLAYLILMVAIHYYTESPKKIFSHIGLCLALIATTTLLVDYFLQVSIVPVSLLNAETEGLPLLIQYNPHGIFLVLEELGYLVMSFSFFFMAFAFSNRTRLESAIKWVFLISFGLAILSILVISINFGLERLDRFEVLIITIDWLVLIINGILLSIVFRSQLKEKSNPSFSQHQ